MRICIFSVSLCVLGVLLTACGFDNGPITLPQGEQEVLGILKTAEISAVRRGTHLIEIDGIDVYYAESALLNLRDYQGKRVTLRGTLEHNISLSDLAVLKVTTIVDVEETARDYVFLEHGLELKAPVEWSSVMRDGSIQFYVDDIDEPIVTIMQQMGTALPKGGVPIVVDATRATRLIDELSGVQIIAVKRDNTILTFRFNPHGSVRSTKLREEFLELLRSVYLNNTKDDYADVKTATGSLGIPCGGTAGILCPDGYFCAVQNLEENIGRCTKIE